MLLVYASANRDEEVFGPDAAELRIDRHPDPHVSFGFGRISALARRWRAEGRVVLEQLLDRFQSVSSGRSGRADVEPGHRRRPEASLVFA